MHELAGIHSALITPFDATGAVDRAATSSLVEFQIALGIAGTFVGGSSGEAMTQSAAERAAYLELVAGLASGRLVTIAHVGAIATDDVLRLAAVAAANGYRAIAAIAPFYYPFTRAEVMAHYLAIADAAALPLIIYNYPGVSLGLSLNELRQLLAHPNIIGVKHTSSDMFQLERILHHCPGSIVFNGYDEMCLAGLATGAHGAIGTTYNFMGDLFVAIEGAVAAGRMDEARRLQTMANAVIECLLEVGVLGGAKAALDIMGVPVGTPRRPFRQLAGAERARLASTLQPVLAWRDGA